MSGMTPQEIVHDRALHLLDFAVLRKEARVAGRVGAPQVEHHQLRLEADCGAGNQGLRVLYAGAVEGVAGGKVVGAVEHHLGLGYQRVERQRIDPFFQPHHIHFGIEPLQGGTRHLDLWRAHRVASVQDLPLQVGEIDLVGIRQRQASDARGGEVQSGRASEPARSDDQRSARTQPLLPLDPDLGKEDVAAVA